MKFFITSRGGDPLVSSYLMLVAFELALKGAGYIASGGHDVPEMLVIASRKQGLSPTVAGQLKSHSIRLKSLLSVLLCQGKNGMPRNVPANSYPYVRYCRYVGDWAGIQENASQNYTDLERSCQQLVQFLRAQKTSLGVKI